MVAGQGYVAGVGAGLLRRQHRRFSYGPQPAEQRPEPLSTTDLAVNGLSVRYLGLFDNYVLTGTAVLYYVNLRFIVSSMYRIVQPRGLAVGLGGMQYSRAACSDSFTQVGTAHIFLQNSWSSQQM